MKKYQVILTRAYAVDVYAKNVEDAKNLAEFFIGDPSDHSSIEDRQKYKFRIGEIEMKLNEASDASEYHES